METEFERLAQRIAEAARLGVQVERMWQQKLEEELELKQKQAASRPR
jgi:hypothetical protein